MNVKNSKVLTTNYSNPCPICLDIKGKCRTVNNAELVMCMTNLSDDFSHIGYKFVGETDDGTWGKYVAVKGDYTSERKEAYEKYQRAIALEKEERLKGSLPIEERDKQLRAISKHLGLTKDDRQKLIDRGLTDSQIEKGLFFSLRPYSKLPRSISPRLAGVFVDRDGDYVIGSDYSQGIACLSFNKEGLVTGYQVRRESKENKYIWAKTGKKEDRKEVTSHLQNGELPLTYHGTGKDRLHLIEGILKPLVAHSRLEIDCLGASGGNFRASKDQALEIIKDYSEIVFVPDAGDVLNPQVMKRIDRQVQWLRSEGINPLIAWYGQIEKSDNDIDEIEDFTPDLITYEELIELSKLYQFIIKKSSLLSQLTKFTPDISIHEQFIKNKIDEINFLNKVFGIKSAKNTGKTFTMKEIVSLTNKPVIWIGHRIVLVRHSCLDCGLFFIDNSVTNEMIESDNVVCKKIGIVSDSLLKLKNINWEDAIVIIDECEQFIESLCLSNTHIKTVRSKVFALLEEKLPLVNSIILMDADLSDNSVNFFANLSKKESIKLENIYQENNRYLGIFEKKDSLLGKVEEMILTGKAFMMVSDSATTLTIIHRDFEKRGIKSLLLTRNNLADDPDLHRYIANKGEAIAKEGYQVVLASPVIQSGISLEIEDLESNNESESLYEGIDEEINSFLGDLPTSYFKAVFGIFTGVVLPSIARQMLLRDRGHAPRFIYAVNRGKCESLYDPIEIMSKAEFKNESLLNNIGYVSYLKEGITWEESLDVAVEMMKKTTIFDRTRAEMIAKKNILLSDYRENLIKELRGEGYDLHFLEGDWTTSIDLKEGKEILEIEESERVFSAPIITESQAKVLDRKESKDKHDRACLFKYHLMTSLPNFELSQEFILFMIQDKFKTYSKIKRFFLANNPAVAKKLDTKSINYQLSLGLESNICWLHDVNQQSLYVELFHKLGLSNLSEYEESETEINRDYLIKFRKDCYRHRQLLAVLGINFSKNTKPLELFKKVIGLFGFTTERIRNSKNRKEDTFIIIKESAWFNDIYSSLKIKYSQEIELINPLLTAESENDLNVISGNNPSGVNVGSLLKESVDIDTRQNQDSVNDRSLFYDQVLNEREKIKVAIENFSKDNQFDLMKMLNINAKILQLVYGLTDPLKRLHWYQKHLRINFSKPKDFFNPEIVSDNMLIEVYNFLQVQFMNFSFIIPK